MSYLNTCLELVSHEESYMAEHVVQEIHGLQLYANKYWYRHLITYALYCAEKKLGFSMELVSQLSELLRLQKDRIEGPTSRPVPVSSPTTLDLGLLTQFPLVKEFILEVDCFRMSLARDIISDRSSKSTKSKLLKSI